MTVATSARLAIKDQDGLEVGFLIVSLRPRAPRVAGYEPLWDLRDSPSQDDALAPVQLIEGEEYLYEVQLHSELERLLLAPAELFDPDCPSGHRGRLRPGVYTGTISVELRSASQELGRTRLEVRSRKLGYLDDYRWMLSALAHDAAEILMQRFSPSELQRFTPEYSSDARTLYQRFAFLQSIIRSGSLEASLHEIVRRPHHEFVRETELHSPSRGMRMTADLGRQLTAPGPRLPWGGHPANSRLRALPREIQSHVTEPSLDTEANRFVGFALDHWRGTILRLGDALERQSKTASSSSKKQVAPIERGLREVRSALDFLDAHLAEELFREISPLRHFPMANQVLERREGYREIYRAFIASEAASRLRWDGGEDVYGAGQRNVATLYEYWVFLELARVISRCCDPGKQLDRGQLFKLSDDGVTMSLRRRKTCVLSGERTLQGRTLRLKLWFNRSFGKGQSWTKSMNPDCSLQVECDPGYAGEPLSVWLHFDAKYKVERLRELLGADNEEEVEFGEALEVEAPANQRESLSAKRADFLKMHAYRDAIHRSAGAYILYPGSSDNPETQFTEWPDYHEILPGLGAFVLRPVESGEAAPAGAVALERFIGEVLAHVANQASRRERAEFWKAASYRPGKLPPAPENSAYEAATFLTKPPADTRVLLGYVKDSNHLEWIEDQCLYNLRADDRVGSVCVGSSLLVSELVVLYGPELSTPIIWRCRGTSRLVSRQEMLDAGYSNPKSQSYWCIELMEELTPNEFSGVTTPLVMQVRKRMKPTAPEGAPVSVRWSDLIH